MTVILAGGCGRANGEGRNLLCRRPEVTPEFKDCESMLNLNLSLGYHGFKSNQGYYMGNLGRSINCSLAFYFLAKGRL